jgi:hypothetical protein
MKFAIVAYGPNDLPLPCLFFSSKKAAEKILDECDGLTRSVSELSLWLCTKDKGLDDHPEIAQKFFTGYYGGCGGVWGFKIHELQENTPMFAWDLD